MNDNTDLNNQKLPQSIADEVIQKPQKRTYPKLFIAAIVLLLLSLVVGSLGVGAFLYQNNKKLNGNTAQKQGNTTVPTQTSDISSGQVLTGKLQAITENLGLLLTGNANNQIDPNVTYYEAGTYTTGTYKGYTRYIAIQGSVG